MLYINDLADHLQNPIELFADDSKVLCALTDHTKSISLQEDINSIIRWTETWDMYLNCSKCKVMHFGNHNPSHRYLIEDYLSGRFEPLLESNLERDLGLMISNDLKWKTQVQYASNKANNVLGILNSTFKNKDSELFKQLYLVFVRPLLEFAAPVWNPYLKRDMATIEKVQKRASKIPTELKNRTYDQRRNLWQIQSLEERRKRGDLIQFFKIDKEVDKINWFNQPQKASSLSSTGPANAIRGHNQRYTREITRNTSRQSFFVNRTIKNWNALSQECVDSIKTNQFKAKIEKFIKY